MQLVLIYLFGVLRHFQHCTGHITTGSWKGRGNQYIEFVRDLYCKLPTNGKQLPAFPLEAVTGIEPRPQRWEARVLPATGVEASRLETSLGGVAVQLKELFRCAASLDQHLIAFPGLESLGLGARCNLYQ